MNRILIATAALLAILNLSGCMFARADGYHYDHGDLVSTDGTMRYIGWCGVHPRNAHCLNTPGPSAAAVSAAAFAPMTGVEPTTYRRAPNALPHTGNGRSASAF